MKREEKTARMFSAWAGWSVDHPGRALLIVLALTLLFAGGFAFLRMEMTFYSLMPQASAKVRDMKIITENFAASSQVTVVVDGRSIEDPREAETAVIEVIQRLEEEFLKEEYSESIEGITAGLDRDFFRNHMLMLVEEEDQERFADLYADLNLVPYLTHLNDDYEGEYAGNDENLEDDEALVVAQFRGLEEILAQLESAVVGGEADRSALEAALDEYIFGETWFLSRDNRMGALFIRPTFTMNDYMEYSNITLWEERAREIAAEYGLEAGLTGMIVVGRDEMVTSEQGLAASMLIAFALIILLMIFAFRMKSAPCIVGIPLFLGVLWAAGLTGYVVRRMNIVTAMYMIALIGLGVDYAVHIIAAYIQERADGRDFRTALVEGLAVSGPGILIGGLTTAAAFFALSFAKTELVSELGLVAGLGILCELAAMLLTVPALLAVRQRRLEKKGKSDRLDGGKHRIRASVTGGLGSFISRRPGAAAIVLSVLGILLATQAGKVELEDNLMNMEARGLTSVELQDTLVDEFGLAPDGLFLVTDDLDEASALTKELEDLQSVKAVESVTSYLPTEAEYGARKPHVDAFAAGLRALPVPESPDPWIFLDELFRLESNLIEMGDMAFLGQMDRLTNTLNRLTGLDNDGQKVEESVFDRIALAVEEGDEASTAAGLERFQNLFSPLLEERLAAMADGSRLQAEDLPAMAREAYISRDGGRYLINIIPRQNPWEGEFRQVFSAQVETVSERGTGMILVSDQLISMAASDGIVAAFAALVLVFLILLVDFRNLKLTVMTFIPLLFSIGALLGLMGIFGIKFDFLNIISIPLLIGIGIDDAVHINHRYRLEGAGGMQRVIAKTGTAVFMTTLTTVIGFASFIPSIMRAMRSTGIVLSLAMVLTFVFSVLLHPALLVLVQEKLKLSFDPWSKRDKGAEK